MPTFVIAGTVPVLVEAVTNWDSTYMAYRNGEIRFDAKSVEAARAHIENLKSKLELVDVHGLYVVRKGDLVAVSYMPKRERRTIVQMVQRLTTACGDRRADSVIEKLSEKELCALYDHLKYTIAERIRVVSARQKRIEEIVTLLKPTRKRRDIVRSYLAEIPDDVLDHVHIHVASWKRRGGTMFISAMLSDHLRPSVAKELFGR